MKIAYFQCAAGISGDMILGALVDAGLKLEDLKAELVKLNIPFDLEEKKVMKQEICCTKVNAIVKEEHVHRHLSDIAVIVESSQLGLKVKEKIMKIFTRLAQAEAKIHNTTIESIHFHEVGALDSIVDICGAVIGLNLLNIERVYCSPIHVGTGFAKCAHGIIPLPAPAVVELLHGIKVYSNGIENELVTPTGAAIISTICSDFGEIPLMNIQNCGYGAGTRDLDIPNLLRICIGDSAAEDEKANCHSKQLTEEGEAVKIEVNIDDMNPQFYEYITEKLFSQGAKDVYVQTAFTKKNRIASILNVNAQKKDLDRVLKTIFEETTTIGVKVFNFHKYMLYYKMEKVSTDLGEISIKIAFYGDEISNISPEYGECCAKAKEYNIPIKKVYDMVKLSADSYVKQKYNKCK
ncbi:nickel pincer cofactor biosynthesis protein LarC [Clostridium sp. Mt-5]|uniref:Pyridinium-3,5-bisthiocarboxylic acid mononucleotide nickel insertion protein n=1 Tax=Clostridium moutaii TaxID=3240932 RepID=A0ABV4BN71_9CLOT